MSVAPVHIDPLRLFWWQSVPNFGDALSQLVVEHLSGRRVVHSGPRKCDMLAIGSLIQVMRRNYEKPSEDGRVPVIWGAGLLHPCPTDFKANVDLALVRGPVTATLLKLDMTRFGDPGLLVADLLGNLPEQQDRIALVPHHSMADDPTLTDLLAREPALELIDVGADALTVCRKIASCRHVISASLHGLIVADACGLPSTWLWPGEQSHLKYYDYAAAIGRPLISPLRIDEIPALLQGVNDSDSISYGEGIARARQDLIETFPAHLSAVGDTPRAVARA